MEVCFRLGGVLHCYYIPLLEWPYQWHKPGPGPINYPAFLQDITIVASLQAATAMVADEKARGALNHGIAEAVKAIQAHAGTDVTIRGEAVGN